MRLVESISWKACAPFETCPEPGVGIAKDIYGVCRGEKNKDKVTVSPAHDHALCVKFFLQEVTWCTCLSTGQRPVLACAQPQPCFLYLPTRSMSVRSSALPVWGKDGRQRRRCLRLNAPGMLPIKAAAAQKLSTLGSKTQRNSSSVDC